MGEKTREWKETWEERKKKGSVSMEEEWRVKEEVGE